MESVYTLMKCSSRTYYFFYLSTDSSCFSCFLGHVGFNFGIVSFCVLG